MTGRLLESQESQPQNSSTANLLPERIKEEERKSVIIVPIEDSTKNPKIKVCHLNENKKEVNSKEE